MFYDSNANSSHGVKPPSRANFFIAAILHIRAHAERMANPLTFESLQAASSSWRRQVASTPTCAAARPLCNSTLDFCGPTRFALRSQWIRVVTTSSPKRLVKLCDQYWGLPRPEVLITVTGGAQEFSLTPQLQACLSTADPYSSSASGARPSAL